MSLISISRREARIGRNLPFRTEDHGDEAVKACDIPLEGLMLDAGELDGLLGPGSHARLYRAPDAQALGASAPPSTLLEPTMGKLAPLKLAKAIEGAIVYLWLADDDRALNLGPCRLKNVTFERKLGGFTEVSCTVQAKPTLDRSLAVLIDGMAQTVQVEISYEHNAEQQQLPMKQAETPADDDEDDEEDDTPPKTRRAKGGGSPRDEGDRAH